MISLAAFVDEVCLIKAAAIVQRAARLTNAAMKNPALEEQLSNVMNKSLNRAASYDAAHGPGMYRGREMLGQFHRSQLNSPAASTIKPQKPAALLQPGHAYPEAKVLPLQRPAAAAAAAAAPGPTPAAPAQVLQFRRAV